MQDQGCPWSVSSHASWVLAVIVKSITDFPSCKFYNYLWWSRSIETGNRMRNWDVHIANGHVNGVSNLSYDAFTWELLVRGYSWDFEAVTLDVLSQLFCLHVCFVRNLPRLIKVFPEAFDNVTLVIKYDKACQLRNPYWLKRSSYLFDRNGTVVCKSSWVLLIFSISSSILGAPSSPLCRHVGNLVSIWRET